MNPRFAIRVRKITGLIVVSSIIGLSLIAFLPCISVTETTSSGETVYNIATMEKSSDEQIKNITKDIKLISSFFWLVLLFSILSFIGIIIHVSGKHSSLAQLIMTIGCATTIFSILVVFLLWSWIKNIETIDAVSTTLIFRLNYLSLGYAHLPLTMGVISLIGSVSYTGVVTFYPIKSIISSIKQKKPAKKQHDQKSMPKQFSKKEEQIIIKKTSAEEEQKSPKWTRTFEKPTILEKILLEETSVHEDHSEPEPEQKRPIKFEKPVSSKKLFPPEKIFNSGEETHEKLISEDKPSKPEAPSKTLQEQSSESKEPAKTSPLFEQALSSAIEKRQSGTKIEEIERQPVKKKISVRCPQCKNIFTVEKDEDVTRIECPKCGKKGIAK